MKFFNNLKIGTKILSGFFIMASVITIIGIIGVHNADSTNARNLIISLTLIGVGVAIVLGIKISRSITNPIKTLIGYVDRLSLGNSDIEIINVTKDEIGTLMSSFKKMVETTKNLLDGINKVVEATQEGKLETRADVTKHNGDYRKIAEGINNILDTITEPLDESIKVLSKLAVNDLSVTMTGSYKGTMKNFAEDINTVHSRISHTVSALVAISVGNTSELENIVKTGNRSENDKLTPAFIEVMTILQNLIVEASMIADSIAAGNIETRGDATKFQGGYREVINGFNKALDSFEKPLNESRKVLSKLAVNDLTMTMTGSYKGTMKDFAGDINSVHARISAVVKLLMEISVGDTNGLEGLNKTGKRSENDQLIPSMMVMMTTIQNLVKEAKLIADAAVAGNLQLRGDASKFQGGYREVIEGFNNALDAVEVPIDEAAEVLKKMADGNLCVSMTGNYQGSYQIIKDSLNHTLEAFNELLGNITDASDQVLSGSNQVSDGSQALSQGTTEQASSIEELTASITEVAAQTKQNAVNASQANELSLNAKEGAVQGNSHMKDMLKSMEEINESSSNISKIIKVIDDIAFQTNMLALNAAVEAARAGQHGKGFAVVAEEVRNLAARSTNAAKETADLIEGSIKKVEFGTKIANSTAESLNEIVEGVSKAATLVGEIAAASNEQATAIYQINRGIEQVSDVVQTNSATAEQSAAASEELSSQASMLKNMVGKFELKRSTSASYSEVSNEANRSDNQSKNKSLARAEAAATKDKPKISLSNSDFGKY